jgi:hypothetical protein
LVAGGLRMTTRPEHHEIVRCYLRTRPSAKLSLAALETLRLSPTSNLLRCRRSWRSGASRGPAPYGPFSKRS